MFEVNDRVVCVEKNPEARVNSFFKEQIYDGCIYIVESCFCAGPFNAVIVSGMKTYWDVLSFRKIDYTFAEQVLANIAQKVKEEQLQIQE